VSTAAEQRLECYLYGFWRTVLAGNRAVLPKASESLGQHECSRDVTKNHATIIEVLYIAYHCCGKMGKEYLLVQVPNTSNIQII
jgi:hypothetical protein